MNIKVLLLPDGDDPDSFARKHSSEELRNYIENEQTDFISFKTRLTVENQTDPVKRSEAISGIVKSISVIPDPILRSTYITDFAQRIGMKEQTLIASLNKNIRQNTDEQEKERERNARRDAETEAAKSAGSVAPEPLTRHTPQEQSSLVATMLIREIIRHGEEIIYDDVETDDGQKISFNVAQYISYDLGQDGLSFANPLYNQVLDEAVAHSGEPGFKAEQYFTNHPDINISHLATQQVIDRHQLGGRFAVQPREGSLRQRVLHLVMDFRLDIVEARLKEIQQQLRQASSDMSRVMELMKQYKETQELRDLLARKLGSDLVVG
jgi:DNA primase